MQTQPRPGDQPGQLLEHLLCKMAFEVIKVTGILDPSVSVPQYMQLWIIVRSGWFGSATPLFRLVLKYLTVPSIQCVRMPRTSI